jgi:signal transduction histidine kinase
MATPPNPPGVLRPKRFEIELPLEFRPQGSDRWWQGKTENISANGALFRTRKRVPPLTPVDAKLQLPALLTGEGTVELLCSGYVVRSLEPQPPFYEAQIAATFLSYKLANGRPGSTGDLDQAQVAARRSEIGNLIHRLNTLLMIVEGNAELVLLAPGNEPRVRSLATQAHQAAEEAATVVRSLAKML